MIENLLSKIFFYHEGIPGSGMSDDLFFTQVYFWIFLLAVLVGVALIEETGKYFPVFFFSLVTGFFAAIAITVPGYTIHFLFWTYFAFWIIYYSYRRKQQAARNVFLFLVSLFFYYKTSGLFFLILLFSTMLDFTLALGIARTEAQQRRKILVILSVTINLLVLAYFKYAYFFTESYNSVVLHFADLFGFPPHEIGVQNYLALWANASFGGTFEVGKILLPVGISFYTFQTISYTVDVYRRRLEPVKNILDFGFYVSFFPQLVSGPIVRAADFLPQLNKPYYITKYQFGLGVFWILNGLLKKAFLADFIANGFIDGVFVDPMRYTGFENLMAIFGYSLQVYADFSGYTDIAIGIALLLGFRLNTNFNSPYKAEHVGEFWKRWHISLSTWLRDYLYIPIGGNRKGTIASYLLISILVIVAAMLSGPAWLLVLTAAVIGMLMLFLIARYSIAFRNWLNTNINLMVTMSYGGLWHGASWNFVIWGTLNGIGLVIYKLWRKISPWEHGKLKITRAWKILVTLSFISFTRIFFRAPDMEVARDMMQQIWSGPYFKVIPQVVAAFWPYYLVMVAGYLIHWLGRDIKIWYRHQFIRAHAGVKIACCVLVAYVSYQSLQGAQPFIYFQF